MRPDKEPGETPHIKGLSLEDAWFTDLLGSVSKVGTNPQHQEKCPSHYTVVYIHHN